MKEILISLHPQYWELIKNGKKTIEVRKTKPKNMFYPFRVFVYVTGGIGIVGKFDCKQITSTICPESFANGSCLTEAELIEYASGKSLHGWFVKENSIVEFETPIPLARIGLKRPPQSWQYLQEVET